MTENAQTFTKGYSYQGVADYGAVLFFPEDSLLVAFDIDLNRYSDTVEDDRDASIPAVLDLCADISEAHDLGRYWIYETGEGWHILYERPCATLKDWNAVYKHALKGNDQWAECRGHYAHCWSRSAPTLRVGLKSHREPDISLRWGKVGPDVPKHIRIHHQAVYQFQQPGAYDFWVNGG